MTQKEVDLIFSISIMIHEDKFFGDRKKPKDREAVQEWVARQLAVFNTYTIPIGSSWGVIVPKERYDEYWNENSKL